MQTEKIILIPPTHEQSVYTYHVEQSLAAEFVSYLRDHGIVPWRDPELQTLKPGEDKQPVVQIEFESKREAQELEGLARDFLNQAHLSA